MPPTIEVLCQNEECFLDMFENHYTYEVPDNHTIADLICPVCRKGEYLAELDV